MTAREKIRARLRKTANDAAAARMNAVRARIHKTAAAAKPLRSAAELVGESLGIPSMRPAKRGFQSAKDLVMSGGGLYPPTMTVPAAPVDPARKARLREIFTSLRGKGSAAGGYIREGFGKIPHKGRIAAGVGTAGVMFPAGYGIGNWLAADDQSLAEKGPSVPAPSKEQVDKAKEGKKAPAEAPATAQAGAAPSGSIMPEVGAGTAGFVGGGMLGNWAAPHLGLDKTTATVGTGALTAILAAIAANRLKQQA